MADPKPRGVVGRRHHPKTRTGCKTCKTRKVKCDEKRPSCGNCTKYNTVCEFLTSEKKGIPGSPLPAQPRGLDIQDLELLHNFTTRTCATLSDSVILVDFYRTSAVQYGLREEYIMRTLLSISASHLAYHRHERRHHYQALAMSHHQIAAKTAMELMTNPTPSQAEGLFLFSVMTIFFALGCPRRDDKFLMVGESGFPHWMFLLQGTKAFTSSIAGSGTDTVLAPLLNHGADRWMAREAARTPSSSKVHEHLDSIRELIALRQPDSGLRLIYAHAIEELQKSFSVLGTGPINGLGRCSITDAFVWIFEVATDFLPLLRDTTQEAVAIFAFFTVFLSKAGSQWCLHGWAEHLIGKCYALLDEEHRSWIQWALEEMGCVL
ncbi:Sterol uptake control protein 2 [Apiospora sp. TS-2023a]